ncbi:hypothetical protein ACFSJW_19125 [Flavobacterium artemisiae]|uniref:NUDIX domain-containing protein n=1 Tax=Flavobacterium artemisiae TaxID=2126556 RepID=A0ABW4HLV9_9FLAO
MSNGKSKIEIDCVIFNLDDNHLKILLVKETDSMQKIKWSLPSDSIKSGETIENTVHKIIKKYTSDDYYFLAQLKAFGYTNENSI